MAERDLDRSSLGARKLAGTGVEPAPQRPQAGQRKRHLRLDARDPYGPKPPGPFFGEAEQGGLAEPGLTGDDQRATSSGEYLVEQALDLCLLTLTTEHQRCSSPARLRSGWVPAVRGLGPRWAGMGSCLPVNGIRHQNPAKFGTLDLLPPFTAAP